eukprot:2248785-Pyramimonas_sp.AAC.2
MGTGPAQSAPLVVDVRSRLMDMGRCARTKSGPTGVERGWTTAVACAAGVQVGEHGQWARAVESGSPIPSLVDADESPNLQQAQCHLVLHRSGHAGARLQGDTRRPNRRAPFHAPHARLTLNHTPCQQPSPRTDRPL